MLRAWSILSGGPVTSTLLVRSSALTWIGRAPPGGAGWPGWPGWPGCGIPGCGMPGWPGCGGAGRGARAQQLLEDFLRVLGLDVLALVRIAAPLGLGGVLRLLEGPGNALQV